MDMSRPSAAAPATSGSIDARSGRDPESHACSTQRYVTNEALLLESRDETHVVVVDADTLARTKLSLGLYRLLQRFQTPQSPERMLLAENGPRSAEALNALLRHGLLVNADALPARTERRSRNATAYKFCNAPAFEGKPCEFVVIGVPYDLGSDRDCRDGPAVIRQKSMGYPYRLGFGDASPIGWFDADRGDWILRGARVADAGDVLVDYADDQAALFARICRVVDDIRAVGAVPVLLGGDRSLTYAAVDRLRRDTPLGVVQFAATPADGRDDAGQPVSADTLACRVVDLPEVQSFHSVGSSRKHSAGDHDGPVDVTAAMLRKAGWRAFETHTGQARALYVSIDLSVVTPAYVRPQDGTATPGLRLHEIKALIAMLGEAHRIVGIDLVGWDGQGESPAIDATAACQLALAAMHAAHGSKVRA